MENNKEIKVRLTTVILLFIILILLVALVGMWFYYNSTTYFKDSTIQNEQTSNLNDSTVNEKEDQNTETIYKDYSKGKSVVIDEYDETIKAANTINYAVLEKYGYDENILKKYYSKGIIAGDLPTEEIVEKNCEFGKYTKPIVFNMAMVKEGLYPNNEGKIVLNDLKKFKELLLKEREEFAEQELYVSLNGLSIINGNSESEEEFKNNSRAKKIKVTINDKSIYSFDLKDTNEVQLFDINYKQTDIDIPITAKIEVVEKYDGLESDDVYIQEIGFGLEQSGFGGR